MEDTFEVPSLRHLRAFEAVAQLESVSRASKAINLSQPAVTQAIANLDAKFRAPLFERRHNGSYLTDFGKILLQRTQRMFSLIEQALRDLYSGSSTGDRMPLASLATKITATHIRSLAAVSENLSFDQAAHSIDISQPSLHRAARDLERLLRRSLYYRGPRGTTTTVQGSDLARRLKLALQEITYAYEEISARKGFIISRIAVGTLSTSGSALLSHTINEFLQNFPQAKIRVVEEPYMHLLSDLRVGKIDFLYGVLRTPDWAKDVVEETLFTDQYVVVVRAGHPLTKSKSVTLKLLRQYDWVVPDPSTPRYDAFRKLFPEGDDSPTTHIETGSRAILRTLIRTSDRITLLTKHEAERGVNFGILAVLPFQTRLPQRKYGVTTRRDWKPTAMQENFWEMLRKESKRIT